MTQVSVPPTSPDKSGLSKLDADRLAAEFETRSAEDVIRWTLETFGRLAGVCTSFQTEGMVILDIAHRIDPGVSVFTIDTGRLPQETHDLIDRTRERYAIDVEVYYPDQADLKPMVSKHGVNAFYRSVELRLLCCELRKVKPLQRALKDKDAWITGLRRSHGQRRAGVRKLELDPAHGGIVKVSPLADWTSEEVWDYIRRNDVPYNQLYDKGYTSIGCAPCTRPTRPGEDARAGRWWWEHNVEKECGIHASPVAGRANGSIS